jgi:hypothetical protein
MALAVVVLVLAGIGTAVWLTSRSRSESAQAGRSSTRQPGVVLPTSSPPSPSPSSASASVPPPDAGTFRDGTLIVTAAAGQSPDYVPVASFVNSYFAAINQHDYYSYASLLGPLEAANISQGSFDRGYAGTSDSRETLQAITDSGEGSDVIARVTFTSHQLPDAENNEEDCTKWRISLYLEHDVDSYLLDQAPSTYHASQAPCLAA